MWRKWLVQEGLADEPDIVDRLFWHALSSLRSMGIDPGQVPNAGATSNGYMVYPYLFHGCFPDLPLTVYRELGVTSRLYLSQIVLVDQLLDGDLVNVREPWLAAQWLLQEATRRLQRLLPPDSPFWDDHEEIWRSYYTAIAREHRHTGKFLPYSREEFQSTTTGIFGPAKVITSALGTLAGQRERIGSLHQAQDLAAAVDQVADDLDDWRADLQARRYSLFLTGALERCGTLDKTRVSEQEVAAVIYLQGFYEEFAQWGLALVGELETTTVAIGAPGWSWTIAALKQKLGGRLQAMRNVRQRLVTASGSTEPITVK